MWVERQPEVAVELPADKTAEVTARWIEEVLNQQRPVPASLRLQLACCLRASGQCDSLAAAEPLILAAGY